MILIHVPVLNRRVEYIFDFYFRNFLGLQYKLSTDQQEHEQYQGAKISYGPTRSASGLFFASADILFEQTVQKQSVKCFTWNALPVFFPVSDGMLPFDPFACGFYLLSRYEEYLVSIKDKHGRYRHEDSLAFKEGFLNKPVVDLYALEIKRLLTAQYPSLSPTQKKYVCTPTIDIDNAYAFKYKGLAKNTLKLLQSLSKGNLSSGWKRTKVLLSLENDPYDSYEKMAQLHKKYHIRPIFFILIGNGSRYDRALSHNNKHFIKLIRQLQNEGIIGLHPSYRSNRSERTLKKEKERLEKITGASIFQTRQHYIKLEIPQTYTKLMESGLTDDHSMGYPSISGFRAGTSNTFLFYDLHKEIVTGLKIHPFAFMDTTLKVYEKVRSTEVVKHISPLVQEVKKTGGHLRFIFHNESIGACGTWKNWENIYEQVLTLVTVPDDSHI